MATTITTTQPATRRSQHRQGHRTRHTQRLNKQIAVSADGRALPCALSPRGRPKAGNLGLDLGAPPLGPGRWGGGETPEHASEHVGPIAADIGQFDLEPHTAHLLEQLKFAPGRQVMHSVHSTCQNLCRTCLCTVRCALCVVWRTPCCVLSGSPTHHKTKETQNSPWAKTRKHENPDPPLGPKHENTKTRKHI